MLLQFASLAAFCAAMPVISAVDLHPTKLPRNLEAELLNKELAKLEPPPKTIPKIFDELGVSRALVEQAGNGKVGSMLILGQRVEHRNPAYALELYTRAADSLSLSNLSSSAKFSGILGAKNAARMYEKGSSGVAEDPVQALYYYTQAALEGDKASSDKVSEMIMLGQGVPKPDMKLARLIMNNRVRSAYLDTLRIA